MIIDLLCTRPPSLIVIDDAQWIDKQSWNLIEHIMHKSKSHGNMVTPRVSKRNKEAPHPITSMGSDLTSVKFNKFQHIVVVVTRPPADDGDIIAGFLSRSENDENKKNVDAVFHLDLDSMDKGSISAIIGEEPAERAALRDVDLTPCRFLVAASELGTTTDNVDNSILDVVTNAAGGNPSHAKIFVSWVKEKNIAIEVEGAWKLKSAAVEISFPESMNAVILSRVDHLDYELSETLKVASCIGYRFEMEVLAHAMNCDSKVLADFLDVLEKKNFLELISNEGTSENKTYKYKEHAVFGR